MTIAAWAKQPAHTPKEAGTSTYLPSPPTDSEMTMYIKRKMYWLIVPSLLSMAGLTISQVRFATQAPWLYPLFLVTGATLLYYGISLLVNIGTKDFDYPGHAQFIEGYWAKVKRDTRLGALPNPKVVLRPERNAAGELLGWTHHSNSPDQALTSPLVAPSVDVFMPVCGESVELLRNSWSYISRLKYPSDKLTFYVLDDSRSGAIQELTAEFGFHYVTRPDNQLQKAGNMHHAFWMTYQELDTGAGEYVLVFDADFCPRPDLLRHLVPYMAINHRVGIVQSPQFFRVDKTRQNWLERGASAVQELFYRLVQQSREQRNAAICVGTNALYRRSALAANGGPTQIGHSEDVHTGFDLRTLGWSVQYVPVNLATGTCPAEIPAFLAQQYRWCMGSMSLLTDPKFRKSPMPWRTRFGYYSGFLYYIMTGVMTIVGPLIPLVLLTVHPELVIAENYLFLLPSVLYSLIIFPIVWHKNTYWLSAFATRFLYGWAHLFALIDAIRGTAKTWSPTGSAEGPMRSTKVTLFAHFRVFATVVSGGGAVAWVGLAAYRMVSEARWYDFLPMLAMGGLALLIVARALVPTWVQTYRQWRSRRSQSALKASVVQLQPANN